MCHFLLGVFTFFTFYFSLGEISQATHFIFLKKVWYLVVLWGKTKEEREERRRWRRCKRRGRREVEIWRRGQRKGQRRGQRRGQKRQKRGAPRAVRQGAWTFPQQTEEGGSLGRNLCRTEAPALWCEKVVWVPENSLWQVLQATVWPSPKGDDQETDGFP